MISIPEHFIKLNVEATEAASYYLDSKNPELIWMVASHEMKQYKMLPAGFQTIGGGEVILFPYALNERSLEIKAAYDQAITELYILGDDRVN